MPVPDNAIYHLAGALDRLSKFGFPLKTNEVTVGLFPANVENRNRPGEKRSRQSCRRLRRKPCSASRAASPAWNSTLRTTCVATQLEGGHAINALPQLAAATVNCRVLPEDSVEYVQSTLQKVVADDQVSIKIFGEVNKAPASAMRPDVLNAVTKATNDLWPGVLTLPYMVVGATDGRYLRSAGIPTYGIQGFFFDRNDIRFHGRDERMGVHSFYEGQAFLYDLVKLLSTPGK